MEQHDHACEEVDIDLAKYLKLLIRRRKAFIAAFLLCLLVAGPKAIFIPVMYRTTMRVQPPVAGPYFTGESDLVSAVTLKTIIENNIYKEAIKDGLKLGDGIPIKFTVSIVPNTNILQVSIDLESRDKGLGAAILQRLVYVIYESYKKSINAKTIEFTNRIKQKELSISDADARIKILTEYIKETSGREDALSKEMENFKQLNIEISDVKEKLSAETMPLERKLIFWNLIQSNTFYLNQLNNQKSDLLIHKGNFDSDIKRTRSEIIKSQMEIEELSVNNLFISNIKVLSAPTLLPNPVSLSTVRALFLLFILGVICGLIAVFIQETLSRCEGEKFTKGA